MGILGKDATNLQLLDFSIRLILIPFSVASIWISVTNKQDNVTFGKLEFNNFIGLKYMVCISAIAAGYALFSALSSWLRCLLTKPWLFFLTDQVLAYLMVTSVAAQGEFLDLAYKGAREVSWSQACDAYGQFCSRVQLAFALHVIAACCFLLLALISAFRVFRTFDPPFLPSSSSTEHQP